MDNSPFRLLPGELRNEIMTLVFSETIINIRQPENNKRFRRIKGSSKRPTAVLKTCRQLYNENLGLFYSLAPITIFAPVGTLSFTIADFLSSLNPAAAEVIEEMTVKCRATPGIKSKTSIGHVLLQLQKTSVQVKAKLWIPSSGGKGKFMTLDSANLEESWKKIMKGEMDEERVVEMMGKEGWEGDVK